MLVSVLGRRSLENPTTSLAEPANWLIDWAGGRTKSGQLVNETSALRLVGVWLSIRILSETFGSLSGFVFRRGEDGRSKFHARDDPRHDLVHLEANPHMTAFVFRETLEAHRQSWGNAYAWIQRNGAGIPIALWPLLPDRTDPVLAPTGELFYMTRRANGQTIPLRAEDVLHVPGLGWDGLKGYSPIRQARETLGMVKAIDDHAAGVFGSGANPGGVLEHPGELTPTAKKNIRESWEALHAGPDNAHRVAVLEEGMKWAQVGLPMKDAQWVEAKVEGLRDIARIFRMQPHKLMDLERATFSNIEHSAIEHVVDTIRPGTIRWEQEFNRKLFTTNERGSGLFVEYPLEALLRGDIKSRFEAYAQAVNANDPWMLVNEIRSLENWNPVEGGDDRRVPLNTEPAGGGGDDGDDGNRTARAARQLLGGRVVCGQLEEAYARHELLLEDRGGRGAAGVESRALSERLATRDTFRGLLEELGGRITRREVSAVRRLLKRLEGKPTAQLLTELEGFYSAHQEWIVKVSPAVFEALARALGRIVAEELGQDAAVPDEFLGKYVDTFAYRTADSGHGQLGALVLEADPLAGGTVDPDLVDILEGRLDEWTEKRPGKIGARESIQASSAFVKAAMIGAGVVAFRWVALGIEPCPMCESLDGNTVGTAGNFVSAGAELPGGDGRPNFEAPRSISQPPLHDGCVCDIVAG